MSSSPTRTSISSLSFAVKMLHPAEISARVAVRRNSYAYALECGVDDVFIVCFGVSPRVADGRRGCVAPADIFARGTGGKAVFSEYGCVVLVARPHMAIIKQFPFSYFSPTINTKNYSLVNFLLSNLTTISLGSILP